MIPSVHRQIPNSFGLPHEHSFIERSCLQKSGETTTVLQVLLWLRESDTLPHSASSRFRDFLSRPIVFVEQIGRERESLHENDGCYFWIRVDFLDLPS